MALLDTMKKVAQQSQNANVPAAFLFGNVTATSPLTIRVDNRFDITGDAIVVMKEFRAGYYPTHTHTIDPHKHTVPQHATAPSIYAQQGKCRNHAAFSTLKTIKHPL